MQPLKCVHDYELFAATRSSCVLFYLQQECLSVEGVPSAQHIDHKKIYNRQNINFFLLDLDFE